MDHRLQYHEHHARVAKRELRAAMALRRLRALRLQTALQLFQATVVPVVDYASLVWASRPTDRLLKLLNPVQRLAAQAVTAYRSSGRIPQYQTSAVRVKEVGTLKSGGGNFTYTYFRR
jgi:hypothetical protein